MCMIICMFIKSLDIYSIHSLSQGFHDGTIFTTGDVRSFSRDYINPKLHKSLAKMEVVKMGSLKCLFFFAKYSLVKL